jgi:hypothetical protein
MKKETIGLIIGVFIGLVFSSLDIPKSEALDPHKRAAHHQAGIIRIKGSETLTTTGFASNSIYVWDLSKEECVRSFQKQRSWRNLFPRKNCR